MLVLYLRNNFRWTEGMAGAAFLVGVIAMVVQGGLIGPLVKRFGELRLTLTGLGLLTVGCLLVPLATPQIQCRWSTPSPSWPLALVW